MVKKPTTRKTAAKAGKAPKPDKAEASPVDAMKAAIGDNSVDPRLRALFLRHLQGEKGDSGVKALLTKIGKLSSQLRATYKEAKKDGFDKFQFDIARQVETPEGEAKAKTRMAKEVIAARYVDPQFDLFSAEIETPATERAYSEGQKASMENVAATPDYAPGTAEYESYLKGFHDHQGLLAKGIKPINPADGEKTAKAEKPPKPEKAEKEAKPEAAPASAEAPPTVPSPDAPQSGRPLSRAEYNRMQAGGADEASEFSKRD